MCTAYKPVGICDFGIDWHCVAEREKFADAVFICTPDRLHKVCELSDVINHINTWQ